MDPVTAEQKVDVALRRVADIRSRVNPSPYLDRPREKTSVFSCYVERGVRVKRVHLSSRDDEVGRIREAIMKSRQELYDRLAKQFGGDDCGCD